MKFPACVYGKQTAFLRIVLSIVTIAPLWLMLTAANISANAQTTSSPADWTQFLRDNMQRWNPYETVLGINNVGSLQVKWNTPIGVLKSNPSSPAVVNGVVYFATDDHNVYALNASTGAKLWGYYSSQVVESSPAVANGIVYVGGAGILNALDASTGALLWSYVFSSYVVPSPAVANGVIYVGYPDHNVYALNANTGAKLWSFTTGGAVTSSPAVVNGVAYVGSADHNLYALNASTGAKLWSYTAGGSVDASPVVANGMVYFGAHNFKVYALNASTGAKQWSYTTGYFVESSPAVANGVVYVGSDDDYVYALNASTGAKLWTYFTGLATIVNLSAPAVANGVVYFSLYTFNAQPGFDNIALIGALDASTGAPLWVYEVIAGEGTAISSPTIVDGTVYTRAGDTVSGNGNVYAFSVRSADLFLRIIPSSTTVHQGDLLTFAFPVWNLGPDIAEGEVLSNLQVPAGTTFDYIRISGTPGLGTCTHPPYGGTGQIICHEGDGMAPNTTWTVRLTVKVTAAAGTVITANAATMADTPDPNLANNMATVSVKVQ